jgi:hypothetical protein
VGSESHDLEAIYRDSEIFVLCRDSSEAWADLGDAGRDILLDVASVAGVLPEDILTMKETLPTLRSRAATILWLRDFFRMPPA